MTAPEGPSTYSERMAEPEEATRGQVLDALADGGLWIFMRAEVGLGNDITLKVECHDAIDARTLKALLRKTLAAMP